MATVLVGSDRTHGKAAVIHDLDILMSTRALFVLSGSQRRFGCQVGNPLYKPPVKMHICVRWDRSLIQ
jgi:hypothetical protein